MDKQETIDVLKGLLILIYEDNNWKTCYCDYLKDKDCLLCRAREVVYKLEES